MHVLRIVCRPAGCQVRLLLTQPYMAAVDESWKSLQASQLKSINQDSYELFTMLSSRMAEGRQLSNVYCANAAVCLATREHLKILKDLLFEIRHCKDTVYAHAAIHEGVVRSFLAKNEVDKLRTILCDITNYGVIPDEHTTCYLMNYGLDHERLDLSVLAVSLLMLQEELMSLDQMSVFLGAISIVRFLKKRSSDGSEDCIDSSSNDIGSIVAPMPLEDEGKDEPPVMRFPYLKNRSFDDHFDLLHPSREMQLVGKTLTVISRIFSQREHLADIAVNLKLLGLVLWQKFDVAVEIVGEQQTFFSDTISFINAICEKFDSSNRSEKHQSALRSLKETLNSNRIVHTNNESIEERLSAAFAEQQINLEERDVSVLQKKRIEWRDELQEKLNSETRLVEAHSRLNEIGVEERQISNQEEVLFFFERQRELTERVSPELLEREKAEEEQRLKRTETDVPADEDYVVPGMYERKSVRDQTLQWLRTGKKS